MKFLTAILTASQIRRRDCPRAPLCEARSRLARPPPSRANSAPSARAGPSHPAPQRCGGRCVALVASALQRARATETRAGSQPSARTDDWEACSCRDAVSPERSRRGWESRHCKGNRSAQVNLHQEGRRRARLTATHGRRGSSPSLQGKAMSSTSASRAARLPRWGSATASLCQVSDVSRH